WPEPRKIGADGAQRTDRVCRSTLLSLRSSSIRMNATFFSTPADVRKWFRRNHATSRELWIGFHKKHTGKPSITWPESVDEALCVGWIDGIRKTIDSESYIIRFPRALAAFPPTSTPLT